MRAAQYIAANYAEPPKAVNVFIETAMNQISDKIDMAKRICANSTFVSNTLDLRRKLQKRMTGYGAHIRSLEGCSMAIAECLEDFKQWSHITQISSKEELPHAFANRDLLICQFVYLCAIREYIIKGGKSRGSYLIADKQGELPMKSLSENFRFSADDGSLSGIVCEADIKVEGDSMECNTSWQPVRPIPTEDNWFENVWNDYRNGKGTPLFRVYRSFTDSRSKVLIPVESGTQSEWEVFVEASSGETGMSGKRVLSSCKTTTYHEVL